MIAYRYDCNRKGVLCESLGRVRCCHICLLTLLMQSVKHFDKIWKYEKDIYMYFYQ